VTRREELIEIIKRLPEFIMHADMKNLWFEGSPPKDILFSDDCSGKFSPKISVDDVINAAMAARELVEMEGEIMLREDVMFERSRADD